MKGKKFVIFMACQTISVMEKNQAGNENRECWTVGRGGSYLILNKVA